MTKSIQILTGTALDYIRVHSSMYLPEGGVSVAKKLVGLLVSDCLALGVEDIRVARSGEWYSVSSAHDWLKSGLVGVDDVSSLFNNVFAMPEAGSNSIRHEVVVAAFSSDVLTALGGEVVVIHSSGESGQLVIGERLCALNFSSRVVAFRCCAKFNSDEIPS